MSQGPNKPSALPSKIKRRPPKIKLYELTKPEFLLGKQESNRSLKNGTGRKIDDTEATPLIKRLNVAVNDRQQRMLLYQKFKWVFEKTQNCKKNDPFVKKWDKLVEKKLAISIKRLILKHNQE
jgi:hypothetical protein